MLTTMYNCMTSWRKMACVSCPHVFLIHGILREYSAKRGQLTSTEGTLVFSQLLVNAET